MLEQDHVAQSVMCLTAGMSLTADPGVVSLIVTRSHTFVEIDPEAISTAILLPSADSRKVVVSYKKKYVHKVHVLVNGLVKLAQEKLRLGELTALDMTIAGSKLLTGMLSIKPIQTNMLDPQCVYLKFYVFKLTRTLVKSA